VDKVSDIVNGMTDPLTTVRTARKALDEAQRAFHEAIRIAHREARRGTTVADIAQAAGLSRSRVYEVLKEDK
jgi:AcrR family transcriptional regulator